LPTKFERRRWPSASQSTEVLADVLHRPPSVYCKRVLQLDFLMAFIVNFLSSSYVHRTSAVFHVRFFSSSLIAVVSYLTEFADYAHSG